MLHLVLESDEERLRSGVVPAHPGAPIDCGTPASATIHTPCDYRSVSSSESTGLGNDSEFPPAHLELPEAFQWFVSRGTTGVLGVSEKLLLADAVVASALRAFSHRELWNWAHDQSQAVVGWQPLPFLDGRSSRLLWMSTTSTGAVASVVVGLRGQPELSSRPGSLTGEDLRQLFPGSSEGARAIHGRLDSLLGSPLSLRIQGPAGIGKDFLAARLVEQSRTKHATGRADPLVLRGVQVIDRTQWERRLADAVDLSRPVLFHDIDQVPENYIHRFLPPLLAARERRSTCVASQGRQLSEFAERMWSRAFRDTVVLPSLGARPEDIPDVVRAVWKVNFGNRSEPSISAAALRMLASAEWAGNVAELESVVLAARGRLGGNRVEPWALQLPTRPTSAPTGRLEDAESAAIIDAMQRSRQNKSAAANLLGISRATLYRKLRRYGIDQ